MFKTHRPSLPGPRTELTSTKARLLWLTLFIFWYIDFRFVWRRIKMISFIIFTHFVWCPFMIYPRGNTELQMPSVAETLNYKWHLSRKVWITKCYLWLVAISLVVNKLVFCVVCVCVCVCATVFITFYLRVDDSNNCIHVLLCDQ